MKIPETELEDYRLFAYWNSSVGGLYYKFKGELYCSPNSYLNNKVREVRTSYSLTWRIK